MTFFFAFVRIIAIKHERGLSMAENKKICFGLVGCGAVTVHHLRAINGIPGAEFTGVYGADPVQAKEFAEKHSLALYASYDEMLDDECIQAVSICTPSGTHASLAVKAMERGKHVIVEKPVALTLGDCRNIINAARRYDRKCEVICQLRFSPTTQAVKGAIEAGALGRIVNAGCYMKYYRAPEYYSASDWRGTKEHDGGGALMNQGIHGIDLMRHLLGSPRTVNAVTGTLLHDIEVEDCAAAILTYPSGAIGVIEGTTCVYPGYSRRFEICGTKGSIILEEDSIVKWDVPLPCHVKISASPTGSGASDPGAISHEGHKKQYEDLISAIKSGAPVTNGPEEAAESVALILAIYRAAQAGAPVDFTEFMK